MKKPKIDWSFLLITLAVLILILLIVFMYTKNVEKDVEIDNLHEIMSTDGKINLTDKNGYYNGQYFVVRTFGREGKYVESTTLHEFAHYYHYDMFTNRDFQKWTLIHNQSDEFITDYAEKNEFEDFADSFEHITQICVNEDRLNDLSDDKKEFFVDNVIDDFVRCE